MNVINIKNKIPHISTYTVFPLAVHFLGDIAFKVIFRDPPGIPGGLGAK